MDKDYTVFMKCGDSFHIDKHNADQMLESLISDSNAKEKMWYCATNNIVDFILDPKEISHIKKNE